MEKFGIIVCPNCRNPKAVDLSVKKTRCFRCNTNLNLKKLKILYKSNSREEITNAIGLLNADLDGNIEKFEKILNKLK